MFFANANTEIELLKNRTMQSNKISIRISADKEAAAFFDIRLDRGMSVEEFTAFTNKRLFESLPALIGRHGEDVKRMIEICTGVSREQMDSYRIEDYFPALRELQLDGMVRSFFRFAQNIETPSISAQELTTE